MARELEKEIDELKEQVKLLVDSVKALGVNAMPLPAAPRPNELSEDTKAKCPRAYELRKQYPAHNSFVSYFGFYESPGQGYYWDIDRSGEALLTMDDDQVAKVLSALSSKQRLAILKAILEEPSSAAELVEKLSLGTTGQVYHHLKALIAADLIFQEDRGLYAFKGHRVSGLLMLLSGVKGMLDDRYSSGTWDEEI